MHVASPSHICAGMVLGLSAFAAAALGSFAPAPVALADDFTDVINAVDVDFVAGQAALAAANADFGSGDAPDGLASFFTGVDDYFVGGPDNFLAATAELIIGVPVVSSFGFGLKVPPDLATVLGSVTDWVDLSQSDLALAATDFANGDFADGVSNTLSAMDFLLVLPPEELILGTAAGFSA